MKKENGGRLTIIFVSVVLLSTFILSIYAETTIVHAELTEQDKVVKVYDWLVNKTKGKWSMLNIKEQAFSLLALNCNETFIAQGNASLLNQSFYDAAKNVRCWKESGKPASESECKITETALAKLALNEVDQNTTDVTNWLISRNITLTDSIYWFLQIDIERGKQARCEIMYQNQRQDVTINQNKTVAMNSTGSGCIEGVFRNYWFKIKQSPDCYSNEYLIKCFGNESTAAPVISTLLYRNNLNDPRTIFFVSSEISQGTLGFVNQMGEEEQVPGIMQLKIPTYCLANPGAGNVCDYEGTAWAADVWKREGNMDYANLFIPYLVVYSSLEVNQKYFPDSFLSSLVGSDYPQEVVKKQQIQGFWLIQPLLYGQFYDTPKAVLGLGDTTDVNITKTKKYLLNHLSSEFSWVNSFDAAPAKDTIRDTAFILWVFWPNYCPGGVGGGGGTEYDCLLQGANYECKDSCSLEQQFWSIYTCSSGQVCCSNVTSNIRQECALTGGACQDECGNETIELPNVQCDTGKKCCKEAAAVWCSDLNGTRCSEQGIGLVCSGTEITAIDGKCCVGSCIPQNTSNLSCVSELGGFTCGTGEVCWDTYSSVVLPFTPSLDANCCTGGTCLKNVRCSSVGKDCSNSPYGSSYSCKDPYGAIGRTTRTIDVEECCLDDCKKTCDSANICGTDQTCPDEKWDNEAGGLSTRCCLETCKTTGTGGKFPWWIIIVIVILVVLAAVYFLFVKKKPEKKEDELEGGDLPEVGLGASRPSDYSEFKSSEKLFGQKPFSPLQPIRLPQTQQAQRPVVRPTPTRPAFAPFSPRPQQPAAVEKITTKKVTKTTRIVKKSNAEKRAGKTKAEIDLEDTLVKLKKMTKK
ncbi:MAG: hypothetical protein NTX24_00180 [Candidatus Pacearchaeota archaeon]|nr:hypothetical protein [Candidatus Pacearchaeota archaeon]